MPSMCMYIHTYVQLWFFDGSVSCFQGAHLFLALVAILMLGICIALIPIVAAIIYHRKIKRTVCSDNAYKHTLTF